MQVNNPQLRLRIETPKALTAQQELGILRAAVDRAPSAPMKRRLARLLMINDDYAEAISLFDDCIAAEPGFEDCFGLALALLARENDEDTRRACAAARRAVELAATGSERAAALAALGKAQVRLGEPEAEATLEAALAHDPHNKDACKRLITLHFRRARPEAALALCDRLQTEGVGHARLFAGRTLALAQTGRLAEARAFENLAQFAARRILEPPDGWADMGAFNAALAAELISHPGLRYERYGTASTKTWRIDTPAVGDSPLLSALYQRMQGFVTEFVGQLAGIDHPWARARPADAILHNWCVITDGVGHEEWHVHQFGWLSGVYYVAVPQSIAEGASDGGAICFGLPEDLAGDEAAQAFGRELVRPQPGLAMLFPSHVYHRTFAYDRSGPERRICLAFDLWPA